MDNYDKAQDEFLQIFSKTKEGNFNCFKYVRRRKKSAFWFTFGMAICLQALNSPPLQDIFAENRDDSEDIFLRRILSNQALTGEKFDILDLAPSELDASDSYDFSLDTLRRNNPPLGPIPQYSIMDAIHAIDIYHSTAAILVYDPEQDVFYAYYSQKHRWASSCAKLGAAFRYLAYSLRNMFPERFQKGISHELVIPISAGDSPAVKVTTCVLDQRFTCVDSDTKSAPILHFGSVFKRNLFPNMISMPMTDSHLPCFSHFAVTGEVCKYLQPKNPSEGGPGLVFGDEYGLKWDDLVPQLIWRGTDFGFLGRIYNNLGKPDVESFATMDPSVIPKKSSALVLRGLAGRLLPRWKGVLYTSEAEVEAEQPKTLPWANIKFSSFVDKGIKTPTKNGQFYQELEKLGVPAIGESMPPEELAKYKYQIDIGGGGGTTWTGTIEKISMPGLLFHHETPTKDYIHDWMSPWRDYVPVAPDLRDLKQKFDWAKSNPDKAKRIADRSTKLARALGTREGFERLFHDDFVTPLSRVIEAYKPCAKTWSGVIKNIDQGTMKPVWKCSGKYLHKCETLFSPKKFSKKVI